LGLGNGGLAGCTLRFPICLHSIICDTYMQASIIAIWTMDRLFILRASQQTTDMTVEPQMVVHFLTTPKSSMISRFALSMWKLSSENKSSKLTMEDHTPRRTT
jgi:hypothetical protein